MWKKYAEASRDYDRKLYNPSTVYEWATSLETLTQKNYFSNFDFYVSCSVYGDTIEVSFHIYNVNLNVTDYKTCVDKLWNKMMSYAGNCPYRIHLDPDNINFE